MVKPLAEGLIRTALARKPNSRKAEGTFLVQHWDIEIRITFVPDLP